MIIELSLTQAEEILQILTRSKNTESLSSTISVIKRVIKHETEVQVEETDRLLKRIEDSSYGNLDLRNTLNSAVSILREESTKKKNLYFDENGDEK
tara:strand:+ start:420 stop:707 length:288 start_codon:yes stop_codon:yes gene_type:complete